MDKATIFLVAVVLWTGVSVAGETAAGRDVPKELLLGSLSTVYEPVPFPHAQHVEAVGGCEDCHHQHRSMQLQACTECHRFDPSVFKKNANAGKLKACGECHPKSTRPGVAGRTELKAAYHQACFKCHREEVAGKPEGCTGMCHTLKVRGNPKEKP